MAVRKPNKKKLFVTKLALSPIITPKALKVGILLAHTKLGFDRNTVIGGVKKKRASSEVEEKDFLTGIEKLTKELSDLGLKITKAQLSLCISELAKIGAIHKEIRKPKGSKFNDKNKRIILKLKDEFIEDLA
jgi:hypothetical protein